MNFGKPFYHLLLGALILVLLSSTRQTVNAQINPPDFICVENDTLKWNLPINNCGPFVSYTVYFSNDINGPYSVLATVTDPTATQYYHNNANSANNTWYYYIESNFNCPGLTIIQSDTLDNRDPDFPPIEAITVSGNDIEIFWTPSQAPETAGYIIYQETANGSFEPIDTVFPGTADYFLDTNVDPSTSSEEYTIIAIDECGNTSIFNTEPQASIFLETIINPCTQTAALSWNLYKNWSEGIENQEIWVSINGATHELGGTVNDVDTTFIYENLNDGDTYCFVLRANRSSSTFFAESNEVCLTADITQPNRNLSLQSVSFTDNDEIELIWRWDIDAELTNVDINGSLDNFSYSNLTSFPPVFPLNPTDTTYIASHSANEGKQFFQVVTRDECDSTSISNYGASIYLAGQSNTNNFNYLEWTPFDIENGSIIEYRLLKKTLINESTIAILDPSELTYLDPIDPANIYDANACYYVSGYGVVEFPDGTVAYTLSRSNTICLEQFSTVRFPNAFAPNGENTIFKPRVAFPNLIASYELNVFDRWGKIVFSSNEPEIGWDGNISGKQAKQGVYIYQMKLIQTDGKLDEQKGNVMLLR